MSKEETITIPKTEYVKLLNDQQQLAALEQAGVDNWSGWGDASDILEGLGEITGNMIGAVGEVLSSIEVD